MQFVLFSYSMRQAICDYSDLSPRLTRQNSLSAAVKNLHKAYRGCGNRHALQYAERGEYSLENCIVFRGARKGIDCGRW